MESTDCLCGPWQHSWRPYCCLPRHPQRRGWQHLQVARLVQAPRSRVRTSSHLMLTVCCVANVAPEMPTSPRRAPRQHVFSSHRRVILELRPRTEDTWFVSSRRGLDWHHRRRSVAWTQPSQTRKTTSRELAVARSFSPSWRGPRHYWERQLLGLRLERAGNIATKVPPRCD